MIRAAPQSDVLVDYLKNEMKEFPSITGPIGFDEKGDRVGTGINLYRVNEAGADEKFSIVNL